MEALDVLPQSWGQIGFMTGILLLMELRHYLPLMRRYLEAKVVKAEMEIASDERKNDEK